MTETQIQGPQAQAAAVPETLEQRRDVLRRFGTYAAYAAYTAPAMTVLLASKQSEAGSFGRSKSNAGKSSGARFSS